jgi:hypothetical protein
VSSVFRHFCNPVLYRDIELDRKEKLESFFQLGEHSDSLVHTKSLSLAYSGFEHKTHIRKPRKILDIISRKSSLETLHLYNVQLQAEPFTASLLSKLSTVTVLSLHQCCFGGFEDFVSFIRCFPRCQVLRLRYCTWAQDHPKLRFGSLPTYDLAPTHLEIMNTSQGRRERRVFNQGKIVGLPWLNLTGMKSFTYTIQDDTVSGLVVGHITTCEFLEAVDMSVGYLVERNFGERKLRHSRCSYPDQLVESFGVSHDPVGPTHGSHKVAHPQVLFRTPPLGVLVLSRLPVPLLPDSGANKDHHSRTVPHDRRL